MPGIVCGIRGGPASYPTIEEAIKLALDSGLPVYFLYVVNLDFLIHTSSSRLRTITEEMAELGEFILMAARNQAALQGVSTEGVIRQGKVREEIIKLCKEITADYVVLGRPRGDADKDVFSRERLNNLVQQIEGESQVKVFLTKG